MCSVVPAAGLSCRIGRTTSASTSPPSSPRALRELNFPRCSKLCWRIDRSGRHVHRRRVQEKRRLHCAGGIERRPEDETGSAGVGAACLGRRASCGSVRPIWHCGNDGGNAVSFTAALALDGAMVVVGGALASASCGGRTPSRPSGIVHYEAPSISFEGLADLAVVAGNGLDPAVVDMTGLQGRYPGRLWMSSMADLGAAIGAAAPADRGALQDAQLRRAGRTRRARPAELELRKKAIRSQRRPTTWKELTTAELGVAWSAGSLGGCVDSIAGAVPKESLGRAASSPAVLACNSYACSSRSRRFE